MVLFSHKKRVPFLILTGKDGKKDEENKNVYGSRSVYESFDIIRM